jgi:hypothetical protein
MKKPRPVVKYVPPDANSPQRIRVGARQLELLRMLHRGPATRLEMLRRGKPRAALNATGMIAALRKKGVEVQGDWEKVRDADGLVTRCMKYHLVGQFLGVSRQR